MAHSPLMVCLVFPYRVGTICVLHRTVRCFLRSAETHVVRTINVKSHSLQWIGTLHSCGPIIQESGTVTEQEECSVE